MYLPIVFTEPWQCRTYHPGTTTGKIEEFKNDEDTRYW